VRVVWVHPSWRDLVIDRLADDPGARRHFLSRCGVHGVVLALSVAGGAAGDRRMPLLIDDRDWDALTDRLYTLAGGLELGEMTAVLTALLVAIDDLGEGHAGLEARALALTALTRIADAWDGARAPVALGALDAWLALADRLRPPPPLPPAALAVTWAELLPVRLPEPGDREALERFADWLELCRLLWHGHPDVWEAIDFGPDQLELVAAFVERAGGEVPPPADEHVRRALEAIAAVVPQLSIRAAQLARRAALDLGGGEWGVAEPSEHVIPARHDDVVDVHRVLADL
jgi:hypothetical protein